MRIVTTRPELRAALTVTSSDVGFVPTMGALHAGHGALIQRSATENGLTVVSIFVNPTQFNDTTDLARYPRDLDHDAALAASAGADLVFAPTVATIYPPGFSTSVDVGELSERWEGTARPGHFRGVATVVTILLTLVRPDRAYFGEKDYQQLLVVRRLHTDLALSGAIVGCPTVREPDGLALSSRNARLSPTDRPHASAIPRALFRMADLAGTGESDAARLIAAGHEELAAVPELLVEYLAVVDPATLEPVATVTSGARALVAARLGSVRLIDNVALSAATWQ